MNEFLMVEEESDEIRGSGGVHQGRFSKAQKRMKVLLFIEIINYVF